jgi:hypothetical protein
MQSTAAAKYTAAKYTAGKYTAAKFTAAKFTAAKFIAANFSQQQSSQQQNNLNSVLSLINMHSQSYSDHQYMTIFIFEYRSCQFF